MKSKIIDLLNKIANGEKIPKKIKYQNYIYEYQHRRDTENCFNYMCNENGEYLSRRYFIDNILNDDVEIIEEKYKDSQLYIHDFKEEIERLNNIINTMLDFNFFKEECPLNFGYTEKCDEEKAQDVFYEDNYCEENCNDDYKKCWLKYFERLQELKGSDSNE